ncbi:MAG: hypothetical protein H6636_11370 [Anaerolineales bacterium]|nr:hypothetical protein [Anaerolineales bacterium]
MPKNNSADRSGGIAKSRREGRPDLAIRHERKTQTYPFPGPKVIRHQILPS